MGAAPAPQRIRRDPRKGGRKKSIRKRRKKRRRRRRNESTSLPSHMRAQTRTDRCWACSDSHFRDQTLGPKSRGPWGQRTGERMLKRLPGVTCVLSHLPSSEGVISREGLAPSQALTPDSGQLPAGELFPVSFCWSLGFVIPEKWQCGGTEGVSEDASQALSPSTVRLLSLQTAGWTFLCSSR